MSRFGDVLDLDELRGLAAHASAATPQDVARALGTGEADRTLEHVAALLSPAADAAIEAVAQAAHALTVRRFGRGVHLFAPLYLSNECLSTCTYCGFAKGLEIRRATLTPTQVLREAEALTARGFRHLLLVSGEHIKAVSPAWLAEVVAVLHPTVPSLSVETQVWDVEQYRALVEAGCEGVVIYQETYDPATYAQVHLAGMKRRERFRLDGPDRAAEAGMRRLGIGALLGLSPDWRLEVLTTIAHARWLQRTHWRAEVTVSFPRLRPSASGYTPAVPVGDRALVLATCALRLALPDAGIVLSTREPAALRDGLVPLGVTHLSAGSSTEPGGYTEPDTAQEQFAISDDRSPAEVAAALRALGYDPVWKDWSGALAGDRLAHL